MAEQPLADVIVLFGGTGDLAQKMLFPSLYNLDADGFLAEGFGVAAAISCQELRIFDFHGRVGFHIAFRDR